MIPKLRLIFTQQCPKDCEGCCNKQFNFDEYPTFTRLNLRHPEVMITGGEPMLFPHEVSAFCDKARATGYTGKLYMYTALVTDMLPYILNKLDGIVLTIHDPEDLNKFYNFNYKLVQSGPYDKSLRLNVFKGVELADRPYPLWTIRRDIEWIPNCPLPKDEILQIMR